MISDQERRDVAEGLRGLEGECVPLAYVLDELGVDCDGADVPKAHVERLAVLIDRPTCSNVDDSRHLSTFTPWFECSSCHCRAKLKYIPVPLRYCPSCGAEVVRDDD